MKENIRAIFVYIVYFVNIDMRIFEFGIESNSGKTFKYSKF